MSSRKRKYIQDGPMWRGVNIHRPKGGEPYITYTGPYDEAAKAKRSVHTKGGYIEVCSNPEFTRVDDWERE